MLPEQRNDSMQPYLEEEEISFQEIFFTLKKHKKKIFWITILTLLITLLYTSLQRPVYESSGLIMIDDPYSKMSMFDMSSYWGEQNYLTNEIELLSSRSMAEKTVQRLLDSEHRNNLFLFGTRDYTFKWITELPGYGRFMSGIEDETFKLNGVVSDSLINGYVKSLRNSLTIANEKKTDMLSIGLQSNNPDEAALLINTLIDVYHTIDLEWATGEMSHLKRFLAIQIENKEIELAESEQALQTFQEEEQIFGIDESSGFLLENLMSAESQLYQLKAESNILNERKRYVQNQLTDEEKKFVESVSNSINFRLTALKNEIALKETELVSAVAQQGESHEIVRTLRGKLKRLKSNLESETRELISQGISVADPIKYRQSLMDSVIVFNANSAMLGTKANEFEKLVNRYQSQLTSLPEKVLEYTRLSRNLNIYAETYSIMRQKYEEVKIQEASQMGKVRIVDEARPNPARISPKKKMNMMVGLILGLGLSIGLIFVIEFFDNTVKSID